MEVETARNEGLRLFGTDGIRGKANCGLLTGELALRVGMAAGVYFRSKYHSHNVVIGKDTRLSCYMLEHALCTGLLAAGMEVLLTGPIPTPAVATLIRRMGLGFGIMISASHNLFDDNGIKLFGPDGYKLDDAGEHEIERLIGSDMSGMLADSRGLGRAERDDGVQYRYIEFAKGTLPRGMRFDGLRVVIDCANGAAYKVAPQTLRELGAEVFTIGTEPNGTNINENCGSTSPKALALKVLELRADLGIALDGDADRVVLIDEKGSVVDGDQILAIIAEDWKKSGLLTTPLVVGTIMSNLGLERYMESLGISFFRAKVGDRNVLELLRKERGNLGGESSGHIIMADPSAPDGGLLGDGLVAALQVLAVMRRNKTFASVIAHRFDPTPQVHDKVPSRVGLLEQQTVIDSIKEIEAAFGEKGRLVVRASGTEPIIRVMAEHESLIAAQQAVQRLVATLQSA
jgi:phosphoglucosamine mutase